MCSYGYSDVLAWLKQGIAMVGGMKIFGASQRVGLMALSLVAMLVAVPLAHASKDDTAVATIQASASKEVVQDEVRVVMGTRVTGSSAAEVNQMLSQALTQARAGLDVKPEVTIASGNFSAFPSYDKEGKVTGWAGNASLVITSQDLVAVSGVIEHLGRSLAVSSIDFSLSQSARQAYEKSLMQDLANEFKERADLAAQAFGFKGYEVVALDFARAEMGARPMMQRTMAAPMLADAGPAVTLEPAMTTVEVSVLGRVRLR